MDNKTIKHSGYVALIGRTNAGKSTFLNAVMEAKISIVSNKSQTTRKQITGIKTSDKGQIIFFDSPGIHKPQFRLNDKMMKDVHQSLTEADLILYFTDINDKREDEFILELIKNARKNTFLVINKIDTMNRAKALKKIDELKDIHDWAEIIPVSALKNLNVDLVEELIYKYLPEGDEFYPEDEVTLQTEKFYISELIREKLLNRTRAELPFTTTVKVEEITDKGNLIYIRAEIYVETDSQKRIIIGRKGEMIKDIGSEARKETEDYFEKKVFLDLYTKVVPNWRNSAQVVRETLE